MHHTHPSSLHRGPVHRRRPTLGLRLPAPFNRARFRDEKRRRRSRPFRESLHAIAESQALRDQIVATAEQEWERWERGTVVETDSKGSQILAIYYRQAVRALASDRLGDPSWHGSNRNPWSAVFVSYVMKSAGAGSNFRYARGHHYYIAAAKRNRMNGDVDNPFWAYRITEIAPQPGDIICFTRSNSGATFDNIHITSPFRTTHGDIVTAVTPRGAVVVGGNTSQPGGARGNTVGKKTIRTDSRGFVVQRRRNPYFAIIRVRDEAGATAPAPSPAPQPSPTPAVAPAVSSFRHSRFRGDPELERIRANRTVMESGKKGPSVTKVQQALIDLGFSLPKFGADGDYGSETRDAIHAFQRAQRREIPGFDVDGRVGFGTIDRLDLAISRLRLRKNVLDMTSQERAAFVAALDAVRSARGFAVFVADHARSVATIHSQSAFLPWHRQFILNFESALRAHDDTVLLPYWDWAADPGVNSSGAPSWNGAMTSMIGGNGTGSSNEVSAGPISHWRFIDGSGREQARGIRRLFNTGGTPLPRETHVASALATTPFDQSPWNDDSATGGFRNLLEGWGGSPPALHNAVHVWIGGDMALGTSPNDPAFFIHHCMVDKIWADWQVLHPSASYLPRTGQTLPDGRRAFGGSESMPVFNVGSSSPGTITPDECLDLTNQHDNAGATRLNVRYI